MAGPIRSLMLAGPVGRLEALLHTGAPDATHAALVCHPHPLHGGTMHNKVVFHAMKALNGFDFPVLRFNFRGAGLSEGTHDEGRGEVEDVRAALSWLESEYRLPIIFCGFSFGAATGLRATCSDPRVVGLISLGTPVKVMDREYSYRFLHNCLRPKLFISGADDEYSPTAELKEVVEAAGGDKKLVTVPGVGHFFEGKLDQMQRAIESWVSELFKPGRQEEAS